jgi:hypothetical protein
MIDAAALRAQVWSAAPFLEASPRPAGQPAADPLAWGADADGYLGLLRAQALGGPDAYFALCCAAHHATVASYVPTDVDSKVRGALWSEGVDAQARARRAAFALSARAWSVDPVSARQVTLPGGAVSGHDGEWLAILIGAHGACGGGEEELAGRLRESVEAELAREAALFARAERTAGAEIATLRAAAVLTHNAGDCDQALSYARPGAGADARARWARLAHEGPARHGGAYLRAAAIYKSTLASEGHRNYPLRQAKALRRERALWLPIAPFLDEWGALVATHPALRAVERAQVAECLIDGCAAVPGQQGYYRALVGLIEAWPGGSAALERQLGAKARRALAAAPMRRQLAVSRASFEQSARKRLAQARSADA